MFVSGPRESAGRGLQQLGSSLQGLGQAMWQVEQKTQADTQAKSAYDLQLDIEKFRSEEEQRYLDAEKNAPASGIGFTKSFMQQHMDRADKFVQERFKGLSESQDSQLRMRMLNMGQSLFKKSTSHEEGLKGTYYDLKTNESLGSLRTQIQNNAAPYGDVYQQGIDIINSADRDESWKMERLQAWKEDSQISKFRFDFGKDPEGATKALQTGGDYYASIRQAESGGNDNAKNPKSSALGRYQFTSGTWEGVRRNHPELGLTADGRTDPEQQEKAIRAFTEDNRQILASNGIEGTNGNLYAAHFLGAGGAVQVLSHGDDEKVADIVSPGVIKANPFLRSMSVGDFKAWTAKKAGGKYDYSGISYENREKLVNWSEKEQSGQRSEQNALVIQHKERFGLQIRTDPTSVTERDILNDSMLDDGDKDTLIGKLRTEMKGLKEKTSAIDWFRNEGKGNPLDEDDRKSAEKAYDSLVEAGGDSQAVAEEIALRKGVIPKQYVNTVRNGLQSRTGMESAQAAAMAYRLQQNAPQALSGAANGTDIQDAATKFQHFKFDMGLSDDEIARKFADMNDPEQQAQREKILQSDTVKATLKKIDRDFVADQAAGDGWFNGVTLGLNDSAGDAMAATYKDLLSDAIVDSNGDMELATKLATEHFNRSYGTTSLSRIPDDVVIPAPPEKTYPPVNGSHEYLIDQAKGILDEEGFAHDKVWIEPIVPELGSNVSTVREFRSGRPAPYRIVYQKGDGLPQAYPFPFTGDPAEAMKQASEKAKQEQEARVSEVRQEYEANLQRKEEFGATRKEKRDNIDAAPSSETITKALTSEQPVEPAQGFLGFDTQDVQPMIEAAQEAEPKPVRGGDPRSRRSRRKNR